MIGQVTTLANVGTDPERLEFVHAGAGRAA